MLIFSKGFRQGLSLLLCVALCASCATEALWRDTDPHEVYFIPADQITESELIAKRILFDRCSRQGREGYLIGKSDARKFHDYTLRALGVPVTVVVDAAAVTLVVVGFLFLECASDPAFWDAVWGCGK